jgi:hypothetical protein
MLFSIGSSDNSIKKEAQPKLSEISAESIGRSTEKFLKVAAYDLIGSSIEGGYQLANKATGDHLPAFHIDDPHDSSFESKAGTLVGSTAKLLTLSKVFHNTLGSRAAEGMAVGATSGLLTPVDKDKNYWQEKSATTFSTAASMGVMFGTASYLARSSFLPAENSLARTIAIGGVSGYAGGVTAAEVDSRLRTGKDADWQALSQSGAQYAAMGMIAGGVLHSFNAAIASNPTESNNFSAKFSDLFSKADAAIAKINPFLTMEQSAGLRPAYAYAGESNTFGRAPAAKASDFILFKQGEEAQSPTPKVEARTAGDSPTSENGQESKASRARKAKLFSVSKTLDRSDNDRLLSQAFSELSEEHEDVFGGLQSKSAKPIGFGKYTRVIELEDGRYKNAVLKLSRFPAQSDYGIDPTEWNPEWGTKSWDAPLLSEVHSTATANGDTVYGYIQEKLAGMSDVVQDAEALDDAEFEQHRGIPELDALFDELHEAGYKFVDPGSRQIGFSNIKQKLVLADYAAVAPESEAVKYDNIGQNPDLGDDLDDVINASQERFDDGEERPVDEQEGMSSVNLAYEKLLSGDATALGGAEEMNKTIASYILDQTPDHMTAKVIEWEFADELAASGKTAKQVVTETRAQLKRNGLL